MSTLKPCPFCGSAAEHPVDVEVSRSGSVRAAVFCSGEDCTAEAFGHGRDESAAREAATRVWNRRTPCPPTDPQPAPVARGPEVFPVVLKAIDRYGESSGRDVRALRTLVESRRDFGLEKYGVTLHLNNGRDPAKDCKDEAGDFPGYFFSMLGLEMFDEAESCLGLLAQVYTLCLEELRVARRRAIERERTQQGQGGER